jgi:hypothetical protein
MQFPPHHFQISDDPRHPDSCRFCGRIRSFDWHVPMPRLNFLIGLSGDYGVGKDTVFDFIAAWALKLENEVRRDAFADRMKLSMARLFFPGIDLASAVAWCNEMKAGGSVAARTPAERIQVPWRSFMERYGTDAHREVFGYDFWIDMVLNIWQSPEILVITDVRFPNEARAVHRAGGQVWEVIRPSLESSWEKEDAHIATRPLPTALVHNTIMNDGTLEGLRRTTFRAMDDLATSGGSDGH